MNVSSFPSRIHVESAIIQLNLQAGNRRGTKANHPLTYRSATKKGTKNIKDIKKLINFLGIKIIWEFTMSLFRLICIKFQYWESSLLVEWIFHQDEGRHCNVSFQSCLNKCNRIFIFLENHVTLSCSCLNSEMGTTETCREPEPEPELKSENSRSRAARF